MKFYKIASFAFLALLSQAAVAQYDLETKKMLSLPMLMVLLVST